jgi:hypothetical protein
LLSSSFLVLVSVLGCSPLPLKYLQLSHLFMHLERMEPKKWSTLYLEVLPWKQTQKWISTGCQLVQACMENEALADVKLYHAQVQFCYAGTCADSCQSCEVSFDKCSYDSQQSERWR